MKRLFAGMVFIGALIKFSISTYLSRDHDGGD